jgi:DNA sulfur modification protein DndB
VRDLIADQDLDKYDEVKDLALEYWSEVADNLKEWKLLANNQVTAGVLREQYVHAHSVLLQALGRVGRDLLREAPDSWCDKLKRLSQIDWRRSNLNDWEGRAMINGRMSKNAMNVSLCTNKLKALLGLTLTPDELKVEQNFIQNKNG